MLTRAANVKKREMRQKAKDKIFEMTGIPLHKKLRSFMTTLTKLYEEEETLVKEKDKIEHEEKI